MTLDLAPLEMAAARVGLNGLRARVVPADRRRGTWFTWRAGELLVSARIVDRVPPEDACALLIGEVLRRRRLAGMALPFGLGVGAAAVAIAAVLLSLEPGAVVSVLLVAATAAVAAAAWSTLRLRAGMAADDEAVALLGDATPLVRGLNLMNEEELHLGGRKLPARPDLHWRAERLARVHQLCDGGGAAASRPHGGGTHG